MKRCPKCFGSIRRMGHIEKPFYCPECKEWFSNEEVTPKPTNADRIRAMTDEELAYFIASDYYVPHCPVNGECLDDHNGCDGCWLVWLQAESGEA